MKKCFIALVFTVVSLVLYALSTHDYIIFHEMGEITDKTLKSQLFIKAITIPLGLLLMTILLAGLIVLMVKIISLVRKTKTLGFFEKSWPYWLSFIIITLGAVQGINMKRKVPLSPPSDYVLVKPDLASDEKIQTKVLQDFFTHMRGNTLKLIPLITEVDLAVGDLLDGKDIDADGLEEKLIFLEEKKQEYKEKRTLLDDFYNNVIDLAWLQRQYDVFSKTHKDARSLPPSVAGKLVEEVHGVFRKAVESTQKEDVARYHALLFEVGLDFVKFLISLEGQFNHRKIDDMWEFETNEAVDRYHEIMKKHEEIVKLNNKIVEANKKLLEESKTKKEEK